MSLGLIIFFTQHTIYKEWYDKSKYTILYADIKKSSPSQTACYTEDVTVYAVCITDTIEEGIQCKCCTL